MANFDVLKTHFWGKRGVRVAKSPECLLINRGRRASLCRLGRLGAVVEECDGDLMGSLGVRINRFATGRRSLSSISARRDSFVIARNTAFTPLRASRPQLDLSGDLEC
jgi:hypothetical protein